MGKFNQWWKTATQSVLTVKERFQQLKRPEIIEPYLNSTDSYWLNRDVMDAFKKENKEPEKQEKFNKIMKSHFVNDIFNLFYNEGKDMKLAKRTKFNDFRYKLIEKVNKSGIKIISNKSTFASTLFTQEIAKYFYELYKDLTPDQLKQLEEMMEGAGDGEGELGEGEGQPGQGNGQPGDGDGPEGKGKQAGKKARTGDSNTPVEEMLDKILNSKESEKKLDEAIQKAEKRMELVENLGLQVNETNAREMVGKLDVLEKHREDIHQLNISKEAILKACKKIMDRTTSHFSARYKVDEVSIFDTDDLSALEGFEFLHPGLRKGAYGEIISREKRYFGKFDLALDNSGSMSASAGLPGHQNVSCMLLAKALALKMKKQDLILNLYEFQSSITKLENTEAAILGMAARGGTCISNVLRKCKETGNNTIIVTDGCDTVDEYLDNVIFLGVQSEDFSDFKRTEVGKQFIRNGQAIFFRGTDIEYAKL